MEDQNFEPFRLSWSDCSGGVRAIVDSIFRRRVPIVEPEKTPIDLVFLEEQVRPTICL
jgi:hypothetical protein